MRPKAKRNTFALHELKQQLRQQSSTARSPSPATNPTQTQSSTAQNQQRPHTQTTPSQTQADSQPPSLSTTKATAKSHRLDRGRKGLDSQSTASALCPEQQALFRQAMRTVEPLAKKHRRLALPASTTKRTMRQHFEQRRARAQEHRSDYLDTQLSEYAEPTALEGRLEEYLNPVCGTDVLRNLKRGQWPLQASIDLHGATRERARERLEHFLQHCLVEEYRCIRIVHGKGYRSANQEPVLLQSIRQWLTQLHQVLAFCDCPPNEGGQGAVKVLLRRARR